MFKGIKRFEPEEILADMDQAGVVKISLRTKGGRLSD